MKFKIVKKDNTLQDFNPQKIINAIRKSAERACTTLTEEQEASVIKYVESYIAEHEQEYVHVSKIHNIVECALDTVDTRVATCYREYRNYKLSFTRMMDQVYRKKLEISNTRDASNANADSTLTTTQKAITYAELNGELYKQFFLTEEERKAMSEGYIYIHDRGARLDTQNCSLMDVKAILKDGFRMGNIDYREPKHVGTAISLITDIMLNAGACQYGGLTVSNIDMVLEEYAENSYNDYYNEFITICNNLGTEIDADKTDNYATKKLEQELIDGAIEVECRLNSTTTARGDFIFSSLSLGLGKSKFCRMINSAFLKCRRLSLGTKTGIPVLFPKLTFMYDENLHGPGKELEDIFLEAVDCTMRAQYPDFLSMSGTGYAPSIYKKYGVTISRMGCVHGKESVIYKDSEGIHHSSIRGMWDRLALKEKVHSQREFGYKEGECILLKDTTILDKGGFVPCKALIKNPERNEIWQRVTLSDGHSLLCTSDHPWSVEQQVKQARDLRVGDKVESLKINLDPVEADSVESTVVKVEVLGKCEPSYDVMTETEHFYCSGIRSHNCRANLSPWYERGGMEPADENDKPIYEGRFNVGAISLHLPMIVAKAKEENKDFFEVLDYYLGLCRKIHIRTVEFLSHKKASINPLMYCEGGAYKGHKQPNEELGIEFLRPMTASFGITALNEATMMYNGKTIYEDKSEFAEKILQHINDYADKYKKEDKILYAIYGTPAESLCSLQVQQFRKKYGVIKGVSDREYMTNSFHMHVSEDITPIEKQDAEYRCFHLSNGGNIMYNRFGSDYNKEAYVSLIRRAMTLGYYYGCNLSKDYCNNCKAEFIDQDTCPICGSDDITQIDRVCGYLGLTKKGKDSMVNKGKCAEIKDRKSM